MCLNMLKPSLLPLRTLVHGETVFMKPVPGDKKVETTGIEHPWRSEGVGLASFLSEIYIGSGRKTSQSCPMGSSFCKPACHPATQHFVLSRGVGVGMEGGRGGLGTAKVAD